MVSVQNNFFLRLPRLVYLAGKLFFSRSLTPPVRLRLFFETSGGAFLKLGQILALRYDLLPESYTTELLNLLSQVAPASLDSMRAVFHQELGREPEKFFREFDPRPIASASVSQVYRARLPTGEPVAVKIQRPGVAEIFHTDIILVSILGRFLGLFSYFRSWQIQDLIDEFADWTRRELDFRLEARNAEMLFALGAAHDRTVLPKIYLPLCTRRVLVSEYLTQVWPVEIVLRQPGRFARELDLREMAYYFTTDMMRQYLIDGFFHADPHPANVFFLSNNRLGYFDFGIVGQAGEERLYLLRIVYGIQRRDLFFASRNFLGFTKSHFRAEADLFKEKDADSYERYRKVIDKIEEIMIDNLRLDLEELLAPWYALSGQTDAKRSAEASIAHVFAKMMARTRKYGVNLPRAAAIFFRTLVITGTVALRLDPAFDILEAFRRFFEKYPLYQAEEVIKGKLGQAVAPALDPLAHLSFEAFLELKESESERLVVARERLGELVMSYAERYEEVRKLLP